MYLLLMFLFLPETSFGTKCGGFLTSPRGVISTPNFPNLFDTPIHCKWTIDNQNFPESWIAVYLTQVYVTEGLTFTENYSNYVKKVIYKAKEENIDTNYHVLSNSEQLEITLDLVNTEGTHLRVLDHLLDVYGFNITYEITELEYVRNESCTAWRCGFNGHCYDHFTHFSCECFPGYSGRKCSEGEKSLCYNDGSSVCKNGGTCMHIGVSTVVCSCQPGFTGSNCEILMTQEPNNARGLDVFKSCPYDGTLENACDCPRTLKNDTSDLIGYTADLFISNVTTRSFDESEVKIALEQYISGLLPRSVHPVQIPYLKCGSEGIDLTIRFYAPKSNERLKNILNNWNMSGKIGNITLLDKELFFKRDPYLDLQSVSINHEILEENDEFILSCVARGSRNMIFRWFKDGMLLNTDWTHGNKWTKLIDEGKEKYSALLGIVRATRADSGVFTCQVEDYGMQQCISRFVSIKFKPSILLRPMTLTVSKGQPFSIKCGSKYNNYIYSWTKDKMLLPRKTETERYDVLYVGGSLLRSSGINKSATYSCLVQDGKLFSESSIVVHVIDKSVISPCSVEMSDGLLWPETAPGTEHKQLCPKTYMGVVSRSCNILETGRSWLPPEYSNCTSDHLLSTKIDFQFLRAGYERISPLEALNNVANYVANRTLLRGEGYVILDLIGNIWHLYNSSTASHAESKDIAAVIFEIVDCLLNQKDSFNKEEQVLLLQNLMKEVLKSQTETTRKSYRNLDIVVDHFGADYVTEVIYRNLSEFLPSKSVIRLKDDRDIEYRIISSVNGRWLSGGSDFDVGVRLMKLLFIHEPVGRSFEWDIRCALAEFASSNYAWDTNQCFARSENSTATICNCSHQGTIALLLVKEPRMERIETTNPNNFIILIGCSSALILTSFCSLILLLNWLYRRSSFTFLKLQCCVSLSAVLIIFLIATSNDIPKDLFLYTVSLLQGFFFMALSSQLSTLLVIYTELVNIQNKEGLKQTAVGIMTGAPLLVVFGSHVAHQSTEIQLKFWWILQGSLSFKVFIICGVIMSVLFIVLFGIVMRMIHVETECKSNYLMNRSAVIKRTLVVFYTVTLLACLSVVYVNKLNEVLWYYVFSGVSIYSGLVLGICLIWKSNFALRPKLKDKFKLSLHHNSTENQQSEKCDESINCEEVIGMEQSPSIQQYTSSPTQLNPLIKSSSLTSPDILGSKMFVELDLVASSLQSAPSPKSNIKIAISRAFEEPLKVASVLSDGKMTTNDEGNCRSPQCMDAVMDSISQDLNYLLNGDGSQLQFTAQQKRDFFDDIIKC